MRIVSENSDAEIAAARARDEIVWPLRELAANLMRVIRGAGKPYDIGKQAAAVVSAFVDYREVVGAYPTSYEITHALRLDTDKNDDAPVQEDRWGWAEEDIVRGCLQMAASDLLGQATQRSAGRHEMMKGLMEIEAIRQENRRAHVSARPRRIPPTLK